MLLLLSCCCCCSCCCCQVVEISSEADGTGGAESASMMLNEVLSQKVLDVDLLINHILNPMAALLSRGQQLA